MAEAYESVPCPDCPAAAEEPCGRCEGSGWLARVLPREDPPNFRCPRPRVDPDLGGIGRIQGWRPRRVPNYQPRPSARRTPPRLTPDGRSFA